jgi:hypothetical protein
MAGKAASSVRAIALGLALLTSLTAFDALADKTAYSISETDIGTLLDDAQARAILDKHIPGFSSRDQIDQARPFTLTFIKNFPEAGISDEVLKSIQADFDRLAAAKK